MSIECENYKYFCDKDKGNLDFLWGKRILLVSLKLGEVNCFLRL